MALVEDDDLIRALGAMGYSVRTYSKGICYKLQVRSRLQLLRRAGRGDLLPVARCRPFNRVGA